MWERHDVGRMVSDAKHMRHPTAGVFHFVYTNLWLDHRPNSRIVVLTPSDRETSERLAALYSSL
jgi:hypothetical protein